MINKPGILKILGLARKANKIVLGGDAALRSIKQKEVKILFLANDSSPGTINRFENKCFFYEIPIIKDFTCAELSKAVGKLMCKVAAIIDHGFYNAICAQLNGGIK